MKGRKERRVFGVDVVAESSQVQLLDNSRLEQAAEVRERRDPESGPDLFSHTCPAQNRATLKRRDFQTSARQIAGGDQAVMPGADDQHIKLICHSMPPQPQSHRATEKERERYCREILFSLSALCLRCLCGHFFCFSFPLP